MKIEYIYIGLRRGEKKDLEGDTPNGLPMTGRIISSNKIIKESSNNI